MYIRMLQIAVPFIWFGAVTAISFMEAPLKFQAPNVTLPLGLGIGRLVFFALNKIEIVLAAAMLISMFVVRPRRGWSAYLFAAALALLMLQTVWLLPVLDVRAEQVIAGTAAPHSSTHIVYIVLEAVKVLLIFALGVSTAKQHLCSTT